MATEEENMMPTLIPTQEAPEFPSTFRKHAIEKPTSTSSPVPSFGLSEPEPKYNGVTCQEIQEPRQVSSLLSQGGQTKNTSNPVPILTSVRACSNQETPKLNTISTQGTLKPVTPQSPEPKSTEEPFLPLTPKMILQYLTDTHHSCTNYEDSLLRSIDMEQPLWLNTKTMAELEIPNNVQETALYVMKRFIPTIPILFSGTILDLLSENHIFPDHSGAFQPATDKTDELKTDQVHLDKARLHDVPGFEDAMNSMQRQNWGRISVDFESRTVLEHMMQTGLACSFGEKSSAKPVEFKTPSGQSFTWTNLARSACSQIRKSFRGLTDNYCLESICQPGQLVARSSSGKSGADMWFTRDNQFLLKTLKEHEAENFLQISKAYTQYLEKNPRSLLIRILCLGVLKFSRRSTYIVLMNNLFYDGSSVNARYDLKGSTRGRITTKEELTALGDMAVLKDMNLTRPFRLGRMKQSVMKQFKRDLQFLQKWNLMDYSVLVGITTGVDKSTSIQQDCKTPEELRLGTTIIRNKNSLTGDKLWLGIIDYLVCFDGRKAWENGFKRLIYLSEDFSAVAADKYSTRLYKFFDKWTD